MKLIVMSTGTFTLRLIRRLCNVAEIQLIGVIPDISVPNEVLYEFRKEVELLGIPIVNCDRIKNADLVLVVEYRKLIDKGIVQENNIINVHAGILPKYRGFSSNAMAILHGEKQVGYTIHKMDRYMDAGDIYCVKKIDISDEDTYSDVHDLLLDDMLNTIPSTLIKIYKGKMQPQPQTGTCVYGYKFRPEYGLIDFTRTTDWIYNLYRCMAKPLGTGMYFIYSGCRYDVEKIKKNTMVEDYCWIEGMIVNIEEEELWVKTKDNIIVLSNITPHHEWKIGMRIV